MGCWLWTGPSTKGYGTFSVSGKLVYAHRHSWTIHRGEIPNGAHVLHKCDTPLCVNPDHLFIGNNLLNVADKVAKGRQARGLKHSEAVKKTALRGERNPKHKLTESDVLEIRQLHSTGTIGFKKLGKHFGVAYQTIQGIVARRYWTHI